MKWGTLIGTIAFLGAVLLQVFARFFLDSAPSWTEEASRLFFIYAISFASGLAFRSNYFVALDTFYDRFHSKLKTILQLLIPISIFFLFLLVGSFAVPLIELEMNEKSPSLGYPMAVAFFSIAVMAFSICYYSFREIKTFFKKWIG